MNIDFENTRRKSPVWFLAPLRVLSLGCILVVTGGCDAEEEIPEESGETTMGSESGGATETESPNTEPVVFASVEKIFQARCVEACHETGGTWSLLDLSGDIHARVVGRKSSQNPSMLLISAGDPAASYLWHKLVNTHLSQGAGAGTGMPQNADNQDWETLSAGELDTIENWILEGATS